MKFYYLREFKKDGGFNNLSICERMILSALLTSKINGDDRDLVEIIMNYDNSQDYTAYTNWQNYKDFAIVISQFLKEEKGYMSDYICQNYMKEDENGNRVLHYVGFEYDDLAIHHKNSMMSIACKAFILGCANHSAHDNNDWFEFNISQWSKLAMNQRKRTIEEIDSFMKRNNINYTLNGNKIVISNKRKQQKSREINAYNELVEEKNKKTKKTEEVIVEEVNVETVKVKQPEVDPTVEEVITEEVEFTPIAELSPKDSLTLGEERRFTPDCFKSVYNYDKINYGHIQTWYNKFKEKYIEIQTAKGSGLTAEQSLRKALSEFGVDIVALLPNYKNFYKIIKGEKLGDDWKEIKDAARIEQEKLINKVCNGLTKLYDADRVMYFYAVYFIASQHAKVLTTDI